MSVPVGPNAVRRLSVLATPQRWGLLRRQRKGGSEMSLRRFVFIVCCFTFPTVIFACCNIGLLK